MVNITSFLKSKEIKRERERERERDRGENEDDYSNLLIILPIFEFLDGYTYSYSISPIN